jgi:hypothetical protein
MGVIEGTTSSWSDNRKKAHATELYLVFTLDLTHFYAWEGNHRMIAWRRHINGFQTLDPKWQYAMDNIILDTFGYEGMLLNAINVMNMYILPFIFALFFL